MQAATQANKNVYLLDILRVQDIHVSSANSLFSTWPATCGILNISFNYKDF